MDVSPREMHDKASSERVNKELKVKALLPLLKPLNPKPPFPQRFRKKHNDGSITRMHNGCGSFYHIGRPFLATARVLMDFERNEIKFLANNDEVIFKLDKEMKILQAFSCKLVLDELADMDEGDL
ncbi:hypothetical protein HAX54_031675 [Datura stramonium]|uniref:Uncharacterized protein n=1 Tax=Datura stramonium TaxID=4076 RepID=A0ABS8V9G5_DATST|nr:hypothetical protein [Datura stramonium]